MTAECIAWHCISLHVLHLVNNQYKSKILPSYLLVTDPQVGWIGSSSEKNSHSENLFLINPETDTYLICYTYRVRLTITSIACACYVLYVFCTRGQPLRLLYCMYILRHGVL